LLSCVLCATAQYVTVVDAADGRGVPLVSLTTVDQQVFTTDSNGVAFIDAPELAGVATFFSVSADGYEYPADAFGFRGKAVTLAPGASASASFVVNRTQLAQRVYRLTGAGLYGDSLRAGVALPPHVSRQHALLNAGVLGQDSVLSAVYKGRVRYFWGDTNRAAFPLGNFFSTGATSCVPVPGGTAAPPWPLALEYITAQNDSHGDGFDVKPMASFPPTSFPTWLSGLFVLGGGANATMHAVFAKPDHSMATLRWGVATWNDTGSQFDEVAQWPLGAFDRVLEGSQGVRSGDFNYLFNPPAVVRISADSQTDVADLHQSYAGFTPLAPGSNMSAAAPAIERDAGGELVWKWKVGTPPILEADEDKLIGLGLIKEAEARCRVVDAAGKRLYLNRGMAAWNPWRQRFIQISTADGRKAAGVGSIDGEQYFAEAHQITGPWENATRVATHASSKYSCYNPVLLPYLDEEGGRVIYHSCTFTHSFSGAKAVVPKYDYSAYELSVACAAAPLPTEFVCLSTAALTTRPASCCRQPRFSAGSVGRRGRN
jgi:hypothetical protein